MFNTSLRRVARSCQSGSPVPSRPSTPTVASFTSHSHQRRHSSSKPPVPPNNGSSTLPTASVKQVGAPRSETKRPASETRLSKKKLAKDKVEGKQDQDDWTSKMPSVPSLQHLNPKDVYVAAFFSTHRPISITGPVPTESSLSDIDKIFQPRPKQRRPAPSDVIYTLSSAVENLDDQITTQKQHNTHAQTAEQKAAIIKALIHRNDVTNPAEPTRHLDGTPQQPIQSNGNVKLVLQEIARRFRPFNVPPPPRPMTDAELQDDAANAAAAEDMQSRALELEIEAQDSDIEVQQVVFTTPQAGQGGFFTSHEAPYVEIEDVAAGKEIEEPLTRPTMGRRRPDVMRAISVKRQRRLKMKKHKYKKLMRKTRNLRRRQDKL